MTDMKKKKTAIIGGGAAGLTAAIFAAVSCDVTIFEEKESAGKKILATGNGRCNFTNVDLSADKYRGNNPEFCKAALSVFGREKTIEFFKSVLKIPCKEKNGYYYPLSETASAVSKALVLTALERGAKIVNEKVTEIKRTENGFLVNGKKFDKVILATGSCANMKKPEEYNGYSLVKTLKHSITKLYPALVQLTCSDRFFKTLSGVRTEGSVTVKADGAEIAKECGELLFADYGISGIPVMQVSRFAAKALDEGMKVDIILDLYLKGTCDELENELRSRRIKNRSAEEAMLGLLKEKLNFVVLKNAGIDPEMPSVKAFTDNNIKKLVHEIKSFNCSITGTKPFEFAQVVAGGVCTSEINEKTMESKLIPGLYFAGELIDIDGTCGGYNLQWAWSSGYLAGVNAAND